MKQTHPFQEALLSGCQLVSKCREGCSGGASVQGFDQLAPTLLLEENVVEALLEPGWRVVQQLMACRVLDLSTVVHIRMHVAGCAPS